MSNIYRINITPDAFSAYITIMVCLRIVTKSLIRKFPICLKSPRFDSIIPK